MFWNTSWSLVFCLLPLFQMSNYWCAAWAIMCPHPVSANVLCMVLESRGEAPSMFLGESFVCVCFDVCVCLSFRTIQMRKIDVEKHSK